MKTYRFTPPAAAPIVGGIITSLAMLFIATLAMGQEVAEPGVEVLTRGPVHEAFAAASMTGGTAGDLVSRSPYEPITELPPDQRPAGDDVAWIPGYWSWDEDRADFIWVSGVWRDLPPGRQWVPGYWATVGGGSQWISGFWGDAVETEVTYLPPPPEPLEVGPSSPAPVRGNLWTPGCWIWQQTRYDWQPGYWVAPQPEWVWSPAHYVWTPRGHVYVPGYWDHDIAHRGIIFAPVYYAQPVYRRPDYYYSPAIVIDLTAIAAFLFVRPRSHHYYFGDYYDSRYEGRGFYPWHSERPGHHGYDPLYVQYRDTQLRYDRDWDVHVDEQYRRRRDHAEFRPPQTLAIQINLINTRGSGARENVIIGRSLTETVQDGTHPQRFSPVNMDERRQFETRGREVRNLQNERARMEAPKTDAGNAGRGRDSAAPARVRMPVSPVAARPDTNVTRTKTPPPAPDVPRPRAAERTGAGSRQPARPEKPQSSVALPEMRRTSPKLPGPPASRGVRPPTATEKPHSIDRRLSVPVSRPTTPETPAARPPTVNVSPSRPDAGTRPPQAANRPEPRNTAPTRAGVPEETKSPKPSPGVSRKPAPVVESRDRQPVTRTQRPEAGTDRNQAERPEAAQSPERGETQRPEADAGTDARSKAQRPPVERRPNPRKGAGK